MINERNAMDLAAEGRKLLANHDGNNGRAMRRYLGRVVVDGQLHQTFLDPSTPVSPADFKLYKLCAEKVLSRLVEYGLPSAAVDSCTSADAKGGTVRNLFTVDCDIATASVRELRSGVMQVVEVCSAMKPFVTDKADELYKVSPAAKREQARLNRQREAATNKRMLELISSGALR